MVADGGALPRKHAPASSGRRIIRAILLIIVAPVLLLIATFSLAPRDWFVGAPRPLPEILHSFGLKLPDGISDVSFKDLDDGPGDQAMITFTASEAELDDFLSTLRSGPGGPVTLDRDLPRIQPTEGEAAGWELDKVKSWSSGLAYSGDPGSFFAGQIDILVDEDGGPSHLVVYLYALKI